MKLPITFVMNQTFSVWTEEDIEAGETNNTGFDFEKQDFTLEELREHIEKNEFMYASESPVSNTHVWLQNSPGSSPADGMPINGVSEGKIWRNLVREVTGEKKLEADELSL